MQENNSAGTELHLNFTTQSLSAGGRAGKLAINMKTGLHATLDPTLRSSDALDFETSLRRKIVGQDPAVEKVAEIYQMFLAGLNPPGRPVGNLLFLGATGSGKTRVAREPRPASQPAP
jgi:hypothetical protein